MSRANSSSRARCARRAATLLGALAVAACSHAASTGGSAIPGSGRVGYVRMDELVKVHPLYSQLARLTDDVQALQLRSLGAELASSGVDIRREEIELQHELDAAAAETRDELGRKQREYAKREQAAIMAALGGAVGPGGNAIANGVAATAQVQEQNAALVAQQNFNAYRNQLIAQGDAATRSLEESLAERAERTYRARAEQFDRAEADFALQQAGNDAAARLSLHTRLSNLALDDASRADVQKQLDALDQKEADALGALKNRDQATLAVLQKQLHDQVHTELAADMAQIRTHMIAKIGERDEDTRRQLLGQLGGPVTVTQGVAVSSAMSPAVRARLQALHDQYQRDFDEDAQQTLAQFRKTRADLTKHFQDISGIDADAQVGASKEMASLQRQRGDLYNEMVEQIDREVKAIAAQRGISVVVSDVVAPAGGVDLTSDAEKDIESLHE